MIAAPEGANNTHLEALSRLSSILMNEEARKKLQHAASADEVIGIIDRRQKKRKSKILQTVNVLL